MSLLCDECFEVILYGTSLFAGTRCDVDVAAALCNYEIEKIPKEKRVLKKRDTQSGVDIYTATSVRNSPLDSYSLSGFKLLAFSFSIDQETATLYLPKHISNYPKTNKKFYMIFGGIN